MGRPNYQRILAAHGKLPPDLMRDFGLLVVTSEVDGSSEVVDPVADEVKPAVEAPDYSSLVDAESGKKLLDMTWPELKAKAAKDGITGKKKDILDAYLAKK